MPARHSNLICKLVPGFPGYRATEEGNVETQWTKGANRPGGGQYPPVRGTEWHPVVVSNNRGRKAFHIHPVASPTGKRRYIEVHTMVCLAFHGLPVTGQEVRHFPDLNPSNNRPENLIWGTRGENIEDRRTHGTMRVGSKSPNAKLTEETVLLMWSLKKEGLSNPQIAARVQISVPVVWQVFNRRTWKHVAPPVEA